MQIPIRPARIPPGGRAGGRAGGRDAGGRDADGLTAEQRRARDDRTAVWAFVWILFGFKAATALVIWWAAARSSEATTILAGTHWFWLILPTLAVAGPVAYQLRVRRVRRRVRELRRSEWLVAGGVTGPGGITKPRDMEALRRSEWMVD